MQFHSFFQPTLNFIFPYYFSSSIPLFSFVVENVQKKCGIIKVGKTLEKSDWENRNEIIEIIIFIHCGGLWEKGKL